MGAQSLFPLCIKRIVIHYQPMANLVVKYGNAGSRIFGLAGTQPNGVRRGCWHRKRRAQWQYRHGKILLADKVNQVAGMFTADKTAIMAGGTQCLCQCEAAHHMAAADVQGGIGAKDDIHAGASAACKARNRYSARSQSSGVSMSCTRWRGNTTAWARLLKMGFSANQAAAVPQ